MNEIFPAPRPTSKPRSRKRPTLNVFFIALSLYIAAFLMLASMQRNFLYHPTRGSEAHFLQMAQRENVDPWRDENNALIGWKREHRVLDVAPHIEMNVASEIAPHRLLILHGNGGHALSRTYFMDGLGALGDGKLWQFYALEYPGYGWRGGEHTEKEILADAERALLQLTKNDARPIFLAGESLGTGVACLLAARHPELVRGLFLATPFTSTTDVAQGRFPMFPVALVMQDRYEASNALKHYRGRVAVLLAGRDVIVPTHHGQKLFDDYSGAKKLWIQPNAGHNTLNYQPRASWWNEVSAFLLDAPKAK